MSDDQKIFDKVSDYNYTDKQKQFVEAFCGDACGNATQAAKLAGYSDKSRASLAAQGAENLEKPKIQAAIRAIRENEPRIADPAEIQAFWTRQMREDGSKKAARDLAKSQGMFTQQIEVSGPDGDPIEQQLAISDMSDEALSEMLEKMRSVDVSDDEDGGDDDTE
jgi:hypothetical protein